MKGGKATGQDEIKIEMFIVIDNSVTEIDS